MVDRRENKKMIKKTDQATNSLQGANLEGKVIQAKSSLDLNDFTQLMELVKNHDKGFVKEQIICKSSNQSVI